MSTVLSENRPHISRFPNKESKVIERGKSFIQIDQELLEQTSRMFVEVFVKRGLFFHALHLPLFRFVSSPTKFEYKTRIQTSIECLC